MAEPRIRTARYSLQRLTIDVGSTLPAFRARYEAAVPRLPEKDVIALVARRASWQEMLELVERSAPFGFMIYNTIDADPIMHLAGDRGSCVSYLMGNHTIAERMFRHEPCAMLHAPLRIAIWSSGDGAAQLSFDKPSDHFASFANADVAAVGRELDRKMAALLEHLDVPVPDELRA
jgi:uncharacterized protein (DUF302 family)